jgi:hypothetical protein
MLERTTTNKDCVASSKLKIIEKIIEGKLNFHGIDVLGVTKD